MRLARNADKLTEPINLTWAEYQDYSAHQLSGTSSNALARY